MYNQSSFQTNSYGVSGQKSFTGGNQVVSQYRGWQKPYQPTGQVQSVYGQNQNQQTYFTSGQFNSNPQSYQSTGFPVQSQYGSGVNSFQRTSNSNGSQLGNVAGIGSQGQMGLATRNYGSSYQGYKSSIGTTSQIGPSVNSWNQTQQFSHTPAWSQSKSEYTPTQHSQFGNQSWNR